MGVIKSLGWLGPRHTWCWGPTTIVYFLYVYVFGVDRIVWVHTEAGCMELFLDGMGGSIMAKDGYARYWQS